MTTPSKPPFRFFGTPKSKSTKSLTTGPTSLIFVPDRRCAAAGANRSRPWKVSESSGRPSLRFVISRTSFSPSRRAAGISSPLSGPTRRAPSQTATMARRFVPTPGSTTPTWTAKGKYGTAEYRTNAPCRTSCGRTLWSRSTIVSSESMERMAPFIAPTYPPGPKSVVSVTIPVICQPSPNLLETFFDALELLLPAFEICIFPPGLCLRLLEFRLAEGVALERLLHRGPIGGDLPLHRFEFRGAVLNRFPQDGQGLLTPLSFRVHPVGPGSEGSLPMEQFPVAVLEQLLLLTGSRLGRLEFLLLALDCGDPSLVVPCEAGLALSDRRGSLLEFRRLAGQGGLGLRDGLLPRPKLSNLDEEIHLLLLQLSLQFLQRRRFLGERPLLSLHLAGAAFELGLLRLMFPQEGRLAGLQVLHGRGLRIRAMAQSELSGLRRLLALLEVLLAAIQVGFPLGEVPSERLGRPDSILKRLFGAEEFRRLFLQAASGFLNLFHGPGGLASLPLKLPRLGRELALPPLELLGFPADLLLLGGELAVLPCEVLCDLLHALGGPDQFVPPFRQGRGLRHDGLLSLGQGRGLRGQLRLPTIEILEPSGRIPFSIGNRLLPFRQHGLLSPYALLEAHEGLLPPDEFSLAGFRFPESCVEGRARFRDLLRFLLKRGIQLAHLFAFPLEGFLSPGQRGLPIVSRRGPLRHLPFPGRHLPDPFGEAPPLSLQLRPRLLHLYREDFPLGLELDVRGPAAFFETAHQEAAGLFDRLQLRAQGLQFLLASPALPSLPLKFPDAVPEGFLVVDKPPLWVPAVSEVLKVRFSFRGLPGDRLGEDLVGVSESGNGRLGIAALQLVDADPGVAVVVGADFESRFLTRRILEDFEDGIRPGHLDFRSVLREDAVSAAQDEHALRGGLPAHDGGLEEAVELHRPQLREELADGLRSSVGYLLHAARRDFHRRCEIIIMLRNFPRESGG